VTPVRFRQVFILLLLLALAGAYLTLERSGLMLYFTDSASIVAEIRALGMLGPVLVIALMVLAIVFNPLPSAPIALAAGAVYGHTLGTIYIVIGAEIGAITAFLIARTVGYEIARRHYDRFVPLQRFGSQNGLTLIVFASRLLPFVSFDLVSYAAGVTPLKAWRFALATLLGLLPMSFLLAHMGSEVADGGAENLVTAVLLLGLLVALPLLAGRRFRGRPDASDRRHESTE
jgi:uncharacterized membrane protein YdjX (TVP38/TMEM64 family)